MAGLLGSSFDDPQTQGLLTLALGLLQAGGPQPRPTSVGQALGSAGMAGMGAYRQAQSAKELSEQRAIEKRLQEMRMKKIEQDIEEERQLSNWLRTPSNLFSMQQPQSVAGDYGPGEAPTVGPQETSMRPKTPQDIATSMMASGNPALARTGLSQLAQLSKQRGVHQVGKYLVDDSGKVLFAPPAEAAKPVNNDYLELIAARDALPQGHPNRATIDARIKMLQTRPDVPIMPIVVQTEQGPRYATPPTRSGAPIKPTDFEPPPVKVGGPNAAKSTSDLRKEFEARGEVKKFREVVPIVEAARSAADNSAGDLQLIYAVGKVLDPESVVREGEMNLVVKSGSPMERISGFVQYVVGGGRLTPSARANLIRTMEGRANEYQRDYNAVASQFEELARSGGLDPKQVIINQTAIGRSLPQDSRGLKSMSTEELMRRREQLMRGGQ